MAGWGGLPPCSLPNLKAHIANRTGEEGEDCGDVISVSSYSYSHCKFTLETLTSIDKIQGTSFAVSGEHLFS